MDVKYTQMATKAINLADFFKATFAKGWGGAPLYHLELGTPDGPSTGGGKQAMQHIKLVPEDGSATLVVGWADPAALAAELRSHAHVAAQFSQRTRGRDYPLDAAQYRTMVQKLESFFKMQGFKVAAAVPSGYAIAFTDTPARAANTSG